MLTSIFACLAFGNTFLSKASARNVPIQARQFPDPQEKYYNGTGQNVSAPVSLQISTQGGGRNNTGTSSILSQQGFAEANKHSSFAIRMDVRGHKRKLSTPVIMDALKVRTA